MITSQLSYLESVYPSSDIQLYINSLGGSVTAGMAIHATMYFIKCGDSTIVMGMAASMGAFLLAAGTKTTLNRILSENMGKNVQVLEQDTDRDNFMTAGEENYYEIK